MGMEWATCRSRRMWWGLTSVSWHQQGGRVEDGHWHSCGGGRSRWSAAAGDRSYSTEGGLGSEAPVTLEKTRKRAALTKQW
jgi:hypothetical protein